MKVKDLCVLNEMVHKEKIKEHLFVYYEFDNFLYIYITSLPVPVARVIMLLLYFIICAVQQVVQPNHFLYSTHHLLALLLVAGHQ